MTVREFAPTPPWPSPTSELTELFLHLLINAAQALERTRHGVTLTTALDEAPVSWKCGSRTLATGSLSKHLARYSIHFSPPARFGGGTGMGLAVCYGIVARHNGSIADREPGQVPGRPSTVRLPVVG